MRVLLLIILSAVCLSSYAQETVRVYGKIVDEEGLPIPNVRIFLKSNPKNKVVSAADGDYSLTMVVGASDSIVFKSIAFNEKRVLISSKMQGKGIQKGGVKLNVQMSNRLLPTYTVTPDKPDTLVGTQEYYISDFAYNQQGHLVLLTYYQTLKKGGDLRLLDDSLNVVDFFPIQGKCVELENDFRGQVHMIMEEGDILWVGENDGRFDIRREPRDLYFKNIAPIIDSIDNNIYYSTYNELYPAFDYKQYNILDSVHKSLLYVEDSHTMEFYRAEFKYLDNRGKVMMADLEYETGIDREIWAGALYYTKTIYYDPIYAPLFKINDDSLLIFDHYKNLMFTYSADSGFVDSTRISYHLESKKSGWQEPLIQDKVTKKIYGIFERGGYTVLGELDQKTGQVTSTYKLYYKYLENLQVVDGHAIYIYRPFESIQRKYLYREELKGL